MLQTLFLSFASRKCSCVCRGCAEIQNQSQVFVRYFRSVTIVRQILTFSHNCLLDTYVQSQLFVSYLRSVTIVRQILMFSHNCQLDTSIQPQLFVRYLHSATVVRQILTFSRNCSLDTQFSHNCLLDTFSHNCSLDTYVQSRLFVRYLRSVTIVPHMLRFAYKKEPGVKLCCCGTDVNHEKCVIIVGLVYFCSLIQFCM